MFLEQISILKKSAGRLRAVASAVIRPTSNKPSKSSSYAWLATTVRADLSAPADSVQCRQQQPNEFLIMRTTPQTRRQFVKATTLAAASAPFVNVLGSRALA